MSQAISLEQYAEEIRRDIEAFVEDWKARHAENPEHYPLTLPAENAGLWDEFFVDFHQRDRG